MVPSASKVVTDVPQRWPAQRMVRRMVRGASPEGREPAQESASRQRARGLIRPCSTKGAAAHFGEPPRRLDTLYNFPMPATSDLAPLQLTHDQMRALGERALAMVIDHFECLRHQPVARTLTRAQTEPLLRTPLPEAGVPVDGLLDVLARDVFGNAFKADHPRFFSFV